MGKVVMIQRLMKRWVSLVAAVVILGGLSTPALAATVPTGSGNGLKVSPVTTNVVINPGDTQTVTVFVQNVTKGPVELQAVVNDFIASDNESGQPALLLDPNKYAPSHSLKRFIAPISDFTLAAGQQKGVAVNITIPKDAIGGGYYGAVRFASAATNSNSNVTLSASVGSLILVKVPGTYKEQVNLVSFDVLNGPTGTAQGVFFSNDNLVVSARFENKGDVQEQPFGKVLLKQGSSQLASYELNNTTPRGNVLPDSIRKFTVKLTKVGIFGQYTVSGNFGYSTNGQLLTGQTTFYVIPLTAIVIVVILLALLAFSVFVLPKMVRRYNEGVLRRAGRR